MTWPRGDVGSDTGVMSDALLRMEYSQDELGGKPSHHGLFSRFGKCVPTDVDFSLFAKRDGGTGLKYAGCLVDRLRCRELFGADRPLGVHDGATGCGRCAVAMPFVLT